MEIPVKRRAKKPLKNSTEVSLADDEAVVKQEHPN